MLKFFVVSLLLVHVVFSQFTRTPAESNSVVEGSSLTLNCDYTNATDILWLREGQPLGAGYNVVTMAGASTFTIISAERTTHNTSFSCQATTPSNTTATFDFNVVVYYIDEGVNVTKSVDDCSQDTVYAGSTVTLTCSPPAAFPAPMISWFNNGNLVMNGENIRISGLELTIEEITIFQAGDYVCRVENAANIHRESEILHFGVTSATMGRTAVIQAQSPLLVKQGAFTTLTCIITPPLFGAEISDPSLLWTQNGAVSTGVLLVQGCEVLLRINSFQPEDAGTYRCQLGSTVSQPVQVEIATLRQTYRVSMSPLSPIGAGREVVFTCTPEGPAGNVDETLSWRFVNTNNVGGLVVQSEHTSIENNGQRLVVHSPEVGDSGTYSCVASHPLVEEVVNSISLVVEAAPVVTVSPAATVVTLGTELTLNCLINSTRENTFSWIIADTVYTQSNGRIEITNTDSESILRLVTVEETDIGNIICVAMDPLHLPVRDSATLVENSQLYIYGNSTERNVTLVDADGFRLECGVRGASMNAEVEWFKELVQVDPLDGYTIMSLANGTSLLLRDVVSVDDEATSYSCKVQDNGISLRQEFSIFVMIPGRISKAPARLTNGTVGSRFVLTCEAEGRPKPIITWRYRGQPVNSFNSSSRVDMGDGRLVFDPLLTEHAGGYSCSIDTPMFMFRSTTLTVNRGGLINLTDNNLTVFVVIIVVAFFILLFSAALGIYCSLKRYRQCDRTTGKYEVAKQSAFDRQPSLRTRPDNSGILSASPSNDIIDALHKSQEASGTYKYLDRNDYPTTIQLDMYSGTAASSTALSDKYPVSSQTSTPLHGTEASVSLFRSTDQLPNFPRTNLEFGDVMGEGEFGPVVMGVANHIVPNQDKTLVAVKVLVPPDQDDGGVQPEDAIVDFANQMKLAYTNISSILGICSDTQPFYVIYEYLDQGDLKKFLRQSEPEDGDPPTLTPTDMRKIILQVADGMAYLFSQRIIHGDLATRNCLISSTLEVKIADLGIGHDLYNTDYYDNGTSLLPIRWMPPELLSQMQAGPSFSLHSDIWSFGVFCWEVFAYAKLPYGNFEDSEILSIVPSGSRLRPPSSSCPHQLYDLMTECWHEIPDKRPQFARLCVAIVDLDVGGD